MESVIKSVDAWESPEVQISARRAVASALPDVSEVDRLAVGAILRVVYVLGVTSANRAAAGYSGPDVQDGIRRRLDALWLVTCDAVEA